MLAAVTPFLTFVAFLLLLLVSLSAPIIRSIYLFSLAANFSSSLFNTSATGLARFGVWGYCLYNVDVSVLGIDYRPQIDGQCSKAHLGYTIDSTVANALHAQNIENTISRATTAALVLHPIACALTFVALLTALGMVRRRTGNVSSLASILTFLVGFVAALLTTIVFLIDVIAVAVVRHRIRDDTDGSLNLNWGNAVWMTLGATVALWGALVGACAGVFHRSRAQKSADRY
ncbi:pali-domain-containing protein [Panus rudis PR-1116 ss-1]|nr:pali-domain-containing protein [Panus rudis PR-1116 ss-1]